jgi:hypothetical protein
MGEDNNAIHGCPYRNEHNNSDNPVAQASTGTAADYPHIVHIAARAVCDFEIYNTATGQINHSYSGKSQGKRVGYLIENEAKDFFQFLSFSLL